MKPILVEKALERRDPGVFREAGSFLRRQQGWTHRPLLAGLILGPRMAVIMTTEMVAIHALHPGTLVVQAVDLVCGQPGPASFRRSPVHTLLKPRCPPVGRLSRLDHGSLPSYLVAGRTLLAPVQPPLRARPHEGHGVRRIDVVKRKPNTTHATPQG